MGLGTVVDTYPASLFDARAVRAVASCDVVFGCMDSIDGRHLLNKLATFYLLPYFDMGVKIEADGAGGVDQVCGTVHYLQPGGSSLLSRHVYTMEQVRAAGIYSTRLNSIPLLDWPRVTSEGVRSVIVPAAHSTQLACGQHRHHRVARVASSLRTRVHRQILLYALISLSHGI